MQLDKETKKSNTKLTKQNTHKKKKTKKKTTKKHQYWIQKNLTICFTSFNINVITQSTGTDRPEQTVYPYNRYRRTRHLIRVYIVFLITNFKHINE